MPQQRSPEHRVIVIGTSAGAVEAITRPVRELPADLPAAVCVVLHFPANGTSVLPRILQVGLEAAFWSALNALEEKAVLARRLAERAMTRGHAITARQFEHQFTEALQRGELIRQALGQATEEAAPAASHG